MTLCVLLFSSYTMKPPSFTKAPSSSFPYFYLLLCLPTFFISPHFALQDRNFPAIFSFGASTSDTGASSAAIFRLSLPYGETYFHMPAGRFSDGRLLIDFIGNVENTRLNVAYLKSKQHTYNDNAYCIT